MHRLLPLLAGAALALACASPASAASGMDVGIADQRAVVESSPEEAAATVAEWRDMGIDVVRLHARWVAHVPDPHSPTMPAGFDPRDPGQYNWERLDEAVALVREAGMRVILTLTGSGPLWSSQVPSNGSPRYKPDPAKFGDFAYAVASHFRREVDDYVLWNEPNVALWLQPQSTCGARGCTPYAPHLYRRLVQAAFPQMRAADPGARIVMGALAPRGSSGRSRNAQLRPLVFLRAMGCVNRFYRPVRTGYCRGFSPASAYGFAYHPHGLKLSPTTPSPHPDDAQLADLPKLVRALDAITVVRGFRPTGPGGRFPLYLTEYGYQTNPPDTRLGVSTLLQSTWLQQAAYIAWRHPRVRNLVQYAWRDEPMRADGAGWQSGLRFVHGRPKGSFRTFRHPFWGERLTPTTVRLWGQVRPGGAHTVTLQRRMPFGVWGTIGRVRTDGRGYFRRDVRAVGRAAFRFSYYGGGYSSTRLVPATP